MLLNVVIYVITLNDFLSLLRIGTWKGKDGCLQTQPLLYLLYSNAHWHFRDTSDVSPSHLPPWSFPKPAVPSRLALLRKQNSHQPSSASVKSESDLWHLHPHCFLSKPLPSATDSSSKTYLRCAHLSSLNSCYGFLLPNPWNGLNCTPKVYI